MIEYLHDRNMWIDKDNDEIHWDFRILLELFSSDSHEKHGPNDLYCQKRVKVDKLVDLEFFENPSEWKENKIEIETQKKLTTNFYRITKV